MKIYVLFLISIMSSLVLSGQGYSFTVDSITQKQLERFSKHRKKKFDLILKERLNNRWYIRIDSLNFDYGFIEERYSYRTKKFEVVERYFEDNNPMPKSLYQDGKLYNPKEWYNEKNDNEPFRFKLSPLLEKISTLKPSQKLVYNKLQMYGLGCVRYRHQKKRNIRWVRERIKTTYQVVTLINKVNKSVKVSLQYAPKIARFKTESYSLLDF